MVFCSVCLFFYWFSVCGLIRYFIVVFCSFVCLFVCFLLVFVLFILLRYFLLCDF